ncbi:MAG TPA: hypothetical protein VHB97_09735, partial [Polyangia bacterium]|nr:hypothetical protein [Polyangia bacterium]
MFPAGIAFHSPDRSLAPIAHTCRIRREKRAPGLGITWGKLVADKPATRRDFQGLTDLGTGEIVAPGNVSFRNGPSPGRGSLMYRARIPLAAAVVVVLTTVAVLFSVRTSLSTAARGEVEKRVERAQATWPSLDL